MPFSCCKLLILQVLIHVLSFCLLQQSHYFFKVRQYFCVLLTIVKRTCLEIYNDCGKEHTCYHLKEPINWSIITRSMSVLMFAWCACIYMYIQAGIFICMLLSVDVFIYEYMYACMYMYLSMDAQMYQWRYAYLSLCLHDCLYVNLCRGHADRYACILRCMAARLNPCTYLCINVYIHIYIYIMYVYACLCVYVCMYVCVCRYACVWMCMQVCMFVCVIIFFYIINVWL
jgi:hypothetical protein